MAAVRHLGFVRHHNFIGPPTKFFHWATSAGQILCESDVQFWRYDDLIFLQISLEMPTSRPKFLFWGSEPLNVIGHHRDPQKAQLWPEPQLHAIFGTDRSTGATCAWDKGIKKARKETYSGKLGVRPDHPRRRSDMWSCMPGGLREVVISFKFRQNRLNGFRDVGRGSKFAISYKACSGLYYNSYYRTSRDEHVSHGSSVYIMVNAFALKVEVIEFYNP